MCVHRGVKKAWILCIKGNGRQKMRAGYMNTIKKKKKSLKFFFFLLRCLCCRPWTTKGFTWSYVTSKVHFSFPCWPILSEATDLENISRNILAIPRTCYHLQECTHKLFFYVLSLSLSPRELLLIRTNWRDFTFFTPRVSETVTYPGNEIRL